MRTCLSASIFLIGVLFLCPPLSGQTASGPQAGVGQPIPDLSGVWEAPNSVERLERLATRCSEFMWMDGVIQPM